MKKDLKNSKNFGFRTWAKNLEKHSSPRASYDYCRDIVRYSDDKDVIRTYYKF